MSPDGLRYISNFVENRRHTNIMKMKAPCRYDVITSCVNSELKVLNRKQNKRTKLTDHTKVTDINLKRDHFTQHRLHMNAAGKELTAQKIANIIIRTLTKWMISPVILKWKDNPMEISQEKKK